MHPFDRIPLERKGLLSLRERIEVRGSICYPRRPLDKRRVTWQRG